MTVRARLASVPLILLLTTAMAAPWLAPHDPAATDGPSSAGPSLTYPLGTTPLGQDVLSRLMFGARYTVLIAATVALIAVLAGGLAGAAAGTLGTSWDRVVRRLTDLVLALPRLPLLLVVTTMAPPGALTVIVAVSALAWAPVARVCRGYVAGLRGAGHVAAARGMGAGRWYLLRRHALPALTPLLLAEAVTVAASTILLESTLSFLGVGASDQISWGGELHRVLSEPGVLTSTDWLGWAAPSGAAVAVAVVAVMLLGAGRSERAEQVRGLA
jgi:peptide/nickel transport system permease protein